MIHLVSIRFRIVSLLRQLRAEYGRRLQAIRTIDEKIARLSTGRCHESDGPEQSSPRRRRPRRPRNSPRRSNLQRPDAGSVVV